MIRFTIACVAFLSIAAPAFSQTTQPSTGRAVAKPLPADQMLSQMLRPTGSSEHTLQPSAEPPAVDSTSGPGAASPKAASQNVLREGTTLFDRTGRLSHAGDGQQAEFAFDSDGATLRDPPMIILPNLKLMAMENAATNSNRDLRFRVTGMVTEFRGRNYILLEKVVVVPEVSQQF